MRARSSTSDGRVYAQYRCTSCGRIANAGRIAGLLAELDADERSDFDLTRSDIRRFRVGRRRVDVAYRRPGGDEVEVELARPAGTAAERASALGVSRRTLFRWEAEARRPVDA